MHVTKPWVLELVNKTYKTVLPYQELINKSCIDINKIKTSKDFLSLPIIDKNYLIKNERRALFTNQRLPVAASCSSGSSGKPTYWFRSDEDDISASEGYESMLTNVLKIEKNESVLALVCFAMGSWVAGTLTVDCLKLLSRKGFNLTIFPCGIEKNDFLEALANIEDDFDHILIYGYPPLLLDFIKEANNRKIPMGKKLKIIPAGDKNSEKWRETIANLADCPQENIVSFYGSADALFMANETPLTFALKKEALQNKALYKTLFDDTPVLNIAGVYQYNDDKIFFETFNNELILTIDRTCPLIRYNLHDNVKVIDTEMMLKICQSHDIYNKKIFDLLQQWQQPFVIVSTRTDVAINYYGINIYYENIKNITEDKAIADLLTGNYFAYIENHYEQAKQNFHIAFELHAGISTSEDLVSLIKSKTVKILKENSTEFRKLYENLNNSAKIFIHLVPNGNSLTNEMHTGIYSMKGRKPKMINKNQ